MILGVINDARRGVPAGTVSAKFHNTMAEIILAVARRVGEERVALSGGCFQNKYLTERAVRCLQAEGFRPYWHQRIPPNDGGIALGQIVAAARVLRKESFVLPTLYELIAEKPSRELQPLIPTNDPDTPKF
jgi:hydrogenase maturation protein HypF